MWFVADWHHLILDSDCKLMILQDIETPFYNGKKETFVITSLSRNKCSTFEESIMISLEYMKFYLLGEMGLGAL